MLIDHELQKLILFQVDGEAVTLPPRKHALNRDAGLERGSLALSPDPFNWHKADED
jgi:hypothetical protein